MAKRHQPSRDSKVASPASYEFGMPHLNISKADEAHYYKEQREKTQARMQPKEVKIRGRRGSLTDDQVREIRTLLKTNRGSDVAAITGISVNTVLNIQRGISYGYVKD